MGMITTRVVVTGVGAICSHGSSVHDIWSALREGSSRIGPINPATHFDASRYSKAIKPDIVVAASPLTHDELALALDIDKPQRFDRHQLFALYAATEAMNMLGTYTCDPERFGCIVGTGDGGLEADHVGVEKLLANSRLDPFANIRELPNIFAGMLANRFGLKGPNYVHCTACAASSHAIMHGADQIKLGRADMMLVGGAEAAITPFGIGSFAAQRALGTDSRPYQKERDGFVMGEGAAMLILESYEHARSRGARILGEIVGYASTADGNEGAQITDPDANGGQRAAELALRMANVSPELVDCVLTHGTATPVGDAAELAGIATWAGRYREHIAISALKSHVGHLLGAAGALATVIGIKMLQERTLIPTRGLSGENLDPACAGFDHIMGSPRVGMLAYLLVNAFGFGGTNASLVLERVRNN